MLDDLSRSVTGAIVIVAGSEIWCMSSGSTSSGCQLCFFFVIMQAHEKKKILLQIGEIENLFFIESSQDQ